MTIKILGIDEILRVFPSDEAAVEYFQEATSCRTPTEFDMTGPRRGYSSRVMKSK